MAICSRENLRQLSELNLDEPPDIEMPCPNGNMWVFAYGSLMWDPGFEYESSHKATLYGYHRRLCLWSIRYRGTPKKPGLVLGLDHGGCCTGVVYKIHTRHTLSTSEYLRERELITGAYKPVLRSCYLENGDVVQALTFVIQRDHPQYSGRLKLKEIAHTVRNARGRNGQNSVYVHNTVQHLRELNIHDNALTKVVRILEKINP